MLQEARKWAGGRDKTESLDYSEKSDGVRGASDGDSGAESINMQQKSLVDMQDAVDSDDSEEVCTFPLSRALCLPYSTPTGKTGIRLGSLLPLVACCATVRQRLLLCVHFNPLTPCRRQKIYLCCCKDTQCCQFCLRSLDNVKLMLVVLMCVLRNMASSCVSNCTAAWIKHFHAYGLRLASLPMCRRARPMVQAPELAGCCPPLFAT